MFPPFTMFVVLCVDGVPFLRGVAFVGVALLLSPSFLPFVWFGLPEAWFASSFIITYIITMR